MTEHNPGNVLVLRAQGAGHGTVEAALRSTGYRVLTAAGGRDALRLCASTDRPDLVILDVEEATADALTWLTELRRTTRRACLPAIVVSRAPTRDSAVAFLDAGATDYVSRPDDDELRARARCAIAAAREARRWRDGSTVDPLTGLLNRRGLLARMDIEIARAVRGSAPLSVAFLDLDNFGWVNEHRGHAFGDDVLRAVSTSLQYQLRRWDVAARWGGDEFVVALPGTGRLAAARVMARIDAAIARLRCDGRTPDGVGASWGIASLFQDVPGNADRAAERLIEEADRAMYRRKHARRRPRGGSESSWTAGRSRATS